MPVVVSSVKSNSKTARLAQLSTTSLSVREVWGSIPGPVKSDTVSPTARHRCDVSSELCSPGAKPRRWVPSLVTRFGVILRMYGNEDFILLKFF